MHKLITNQIVMDDDHDDRFWNGIPKAGKRPLIVTSKRSISYSREDIDNWNESSSSSSQSGSNDSAEAMDYDFDSSSISIKSSEEEAQPSTPKKLRLRLQSSSIAIECPPPLPTPPLPKPVICRIFMETYSEIKKSFPAPKLLFGNIVQFIQSHSQAPMIFREIICRHLTSKQFLGLRQLCRAFRNLFEKIYNKKLEDSGMFQEYYMTPRIKGFRQRSEKLCTYIYRSIYKKAFDVYNRFGQQPPKSVGRRKVPLPITIENPGTMKAFARFDRVIEAISNVLTNNRASQRKELKRILDIPIQAMKAHEIILETMDKYPHTSYHDNFKENTEQFVLHLEAKLFIIVQCPTLIDLPDYMKEPINSITAIKTLVREINETLYYFVEAANNNDYVCDVVRYLIGRSKIGELLMFTAIFWGGSKNEWDVFEDGTRDEILDEFEISAIIKLMSSTTAHDNWDGMMRGGVIVRTCRDLLKLKFINGEPRKNFVTGVISSLHS